MLAAKTKSHVIKVTGVTDELLDLLDARVQQRHATGRAEYIRELIRKDVLDSSPTFREILAPLHEEAKRQAIPDTELDALFDQARNEVYQSRSSRQPQ
jgi:hypothetical protein